jgi:DNA-binding GntR family transcriptional regulator
MSVDRTPPYLQVVKAIQDRIVSGDLAEGDEVPSIRKIAEEWEISQATAMKALATLRASKLVESVPGKGTVVRAQATLHRAPHDRFARMLATGKIYAPGEYATIESAELAPAPAHIADALGITENAPAIRRHRVTHNERGPISCSTSWFHPDLATVVPALLVKERIQGGTPSAIEAATGRRARSVSDQFTAAAATAEQARELGIAEGSPVIVGRNTLMDGDGEVLEAGEYVAPGGRWSLYESEFQA